MIKGDKILIRQGFNGVWFENFPARTSDDDNTFTYSMLDALIAEEAADDIADELKSSVTVDFSALDKKYENKVRKELQSYRTMTHVEIEQMEALLLKELFS